MYCENYEELELGIFTVFMILVEGLHGDSKVRGVNLGGWLVVEGWIKPSLFDGIPNGDLLVRTLLLDIWISA